jgi:transposase-like protein
MGKRSYRRYEDAFKSQLIEQIQSGQLSAGQAAREHQISRSLIERWRDQYLGKSLVEKPSIRERHLEAENKKLKAKIADLVMEMDQIKKLQAWVQQKRSADTSVITSKNLDLFRKPAK